MKNTLDDPVEPLPASIIGNRTAIHELKENVLAHAARRDNPHVVTAAQTKALPVDGTAADSVLLESSTKAEVIASAKSDRVPNTREVNGRALSNNIDIDKGDVGLGKVPNYDASDAVNSTDAAFATSTAAKSAYDRGSLGITKADQALAGVDDLTGIVASQIKHMGGVDLSEGAYPDKPNYSAMWHVIVGGTVEGVRSHVSVGIDSESVDYDEGDTLIFSIDLDMFYKVSDKASIGREEVYDTFLEKTERATDSSKLENRTKAQVIEEAREGFPSDTRKINTAAPLSGGGDLSADRTLSVRDATVETNGVVQLSDAINSTSDELAATANAAKKAYDRGTSGINAANGVSAALEEHMEDKENPHEVTAAQTGALAAGGTAVNSSKLEGSTKAEVIASAKADRVPVTRKVAGKELKEDVVVTKTDVGLSNVDNVKQAAEAVTVTGSNGLSGGGNLADNRVISGVNATTEAKGVVQLSDAVNSTSIVLAATANAVKIAYDLADSKLDGSGGEIEGDLTVDGTITATGDVTAYSDISLKENVEPLENALGMINKLSGHRYTLKSSNEESIGMIAQEAETVIPELIHENVDGLKSIAYGNVVAILIEAVKELTVKVNMLESKVG